MMHNRAGNTLNMYSFTFNIVCFFFVFHLPGQGSNVRIESKYDSTYAFDEYIVAYGPLLKGKNPGAASSSSTLSGWLVDISASGSVREER
jgi:hypothetical protein